MKILSKKARRKEEADPN